VNAPFVRIDDRLVHGQVLVAWATSFEPQRILLASDEVAADPERSALYGSLGAGDYEIAVMQVDAAAAALRESERRGPRTFAVVGSATDARRLVELGAPVARLNLGGLHPGREKRRLLDYVFLSAGDATELRALIDRGVELEARDLPGSRGVRIDRAALEGVWPERPA
jgi:mannose/fructose/N-acetylgalactosamine-specific phosphotransferase system component IIB